MKTLFRPPNFSRHIACIADDAALAATLSSLVGDEEEYVSVLESPRMGRLDPHNEVVRRCNAVAKVRPKTVLLAGLDPEAETSITSCLGRSVIARRAQTADDIVAVARPAQRNGLAGELRCRLSEIGQGLLRAKRERKLLLVDESAPPLPMEDLASADHVVVLDDHRSLAQVIAANYAYSMGADLTLIPERDDSLREDVYTEIDVRVACRGEDRGVRALKCLQALRSLLEPNLRFGPRKFVTFITRGIPYGYFYSDAPSTHLFSHPHLGEIINAGIYWATSEPFVSAAVLIDPGDFPSSETPAVSASLKSDGVCVFEVLGDRANLENVELFFKAFPYDLMFVCSHCGEVGGERLTIRVHDAEGTAHTIVIEEVVEFSSTRFGTNPGKTVGVHQLLHPLSIDGVDWHSAGEELTQHIRAIWDYLLKTPSTEMGHIVPRGGQARSVQHGH